MISHEASFIMLRGKEGERDRDRKGGREGGVGCCQEPRNPE